MMKWSARRIFSLFLGLWIALAPAIYIVPVAAMSAQTGMSDDAGPGGGSCCPDGEMERGLCKLMCLNAMQAAITAETGKFIAETGDHHDPGRLRTMKSSLSAPDPAPPKPVSLL